MLTVPLLIGYPSLLGKPLRRKPQPFPEPPSVPDGEEKLHSAFKSHVS